MMGKRRTRTERTCCSNVAGKQTFEMTARTQKLKKKGGGGGGGIVSYPELD